MGVLIWNKIIVLSLFEVQDYSPVKMCKQPAYSKLFAPYFILGLHCEFSDRQGLLAVNSCLLLHPYCYYNFDSTGIIIVLFQKILGLLHFLAIEL